MQGLITNKAFAEANGVTTLDALVNDPAQFAAYEAADVSPGDGVLQIMGCPEGWGCRVNIDSWIANAGWTNVEQFDIGGYDALIADAIARDAAGEPYLVYTWAPSHYVKDLRPGDNSVWLSIHDGAISDTQIEGPKSLGDQCTTDNCNLGWDAADIRVTGNNDFLAANPAAARLFELVTINPVDVTLQNVAYSLGENTEDDIKRHAAEWIADNRDTVDAWLHTAMQPISMTPGDGVSVTMARANWSTGYMQAAIYAALMAELGYDVSDPSDLELAPSNAFVAMANGEFAFWVNSWFPNHNQFLAGEMPDGSLVSEHVTTLGYEMSRSGVQGLITNKAFAEANGVTTLDALVNDPAQFAAYEAADVSPGDGVLQIMGCPEGWGCRVNIDSWIANAGWTNVEQFDIGGYDALIADAIARDAAGEPYLVYTWAPSHYVKDLRPGDNSVWLSIHDGAISDTQIEGPKSLGDQCTTDNCNLGWDAADIRVTGNNDFLAANPAAARLFELFTINPVDVTLQNVAYSLGENTEDDIKRHAAEWIADNRDTVDAWLHTAMQPISMTPGDGVSVTMARANWSTGYMQAAIYAALMAELGYDVSDPSDLELAPSNAFVAMANGEFAFWVNSWFPNHNQFLAGEMPDGSLVSEHVTTLGYEMSRSGVQGLITNKAFAEANGVTTLDALVNDPAQFAAYEAADVSPGDGVLQIMGCPEGWGCRVNIDSWIANAGWTNVEQFDIGGYDALIADAIARDAAGEPYLVYTWAPSHYVKDLRPGDNSVWLSIHDGAISDTQIEGPKSLGDQCTTDNCNLGWDAADIRVTGNNDFLAANPAAARLFELVTINPVDVTLQNVAYSLGENTEDDIKRHAAEWIADNRDTVDAWLHTAMQPISMTPGDGVSVTMARANWSTGYMQAAIYAALMAELGYDVSDPSDLELAPSNAFVAMANGEFAFWVNSWFPNHNQFLAGEMPDGSLVSEHVTTLGYEMSRRVCRG